MFDGREPIYLQIADQIRTEIASGALGEEEQVMSTTQYATTYRINPATAAKAFAELVAEGVVYKRRGVGMFVATGARERLLAEQREHFFADVLEPMVRSARLLGVPLAEIEERVRGLYAVSPGPIAIRRFPAPRSSGGAAAPAPDDSNEEDR